MKARRASAKMLCLGIVLGILPVAQAFAGDGAEVERGRYLVAAGDCAACHTDRGGKPFAGGRAIKTPFGTIYSRNITPDPATGIGAWTDDDFYRALHEGISIDGSHLYPAFPYPWYTKLTRADVHSIKVYLDTLAPVRQHIPANDLDWPLGWRALVGAWNRMFFTAGEFQPNPAKSEQWNRGAYLVEGAGHCGACHSPKNIAGAVKKGSAFEGGMGEGWLAPDLTGHALDGLSDWTVDEIAAFLKTGVTKHARALGPMAEVVEKSTSRLTVEDAAAIATYLKDLPNGASAVHADKVAASQNHDAGRGLYMDNCTACHMENGEGQPGVFPALKGSALAESRNAATAIRLILGGGAAASTTANPNRFAMPAFAGKLSDDDIAKLLSYVRQSWGNAAPDISRGDVAGVRKQMRADVPAHTGS